uniref:Uncharacterized protein n=1 Tax=Arundo donax TaxID=35708 RepID=A0A0A9DX54_ARUDO
MITSPLYSHTKVPGCIKSSVLTPHPVSVERNTSSRCFMPRCVTRFAQVAGHPHREPHSYTTGLPITRVPSSLYTGPPVFFLSHLHLEPQPVAQ